MEFQEITLHRLNPQTTLNLTEQTISFAGATLTIKEFGAFHNRVTKLLERYNLLPKSAPSGDGYGRHPFLLNNLKEISTRKRGKIKKAPFWLRWYCDATVSKEPYASV